MNCWDKAIKECPSYVKGGMCAILRGNKRCSNAVTSGKCPIKQLENKFNHKGGELGRRGV